MIGLLLLQLGGGIVPTLSPGKAKPTATALVCSFSWHADDPANLNATLWGVALGRYGLTFEQRNDYQPAWVIPSALGGLAMTTNIAPLPKTSEWNLARKQLVEHRVYDELCAGRLTLSEAQNKAGVNWLVGHRIYFGR